MADTFDDDVDEFSGVVEEEYVPVRIALITFSSVIIACAAFIFSVFKIGRDVLRHPPEYSLYRLPYVLLLDLVVAVYAMYALKESHEMEGSAPRGMALAAVAISFLAGAIVTYSLYNFYVLVQQAHS